MIKVSDEKLYREVAKMRAQVEQIAFRLRYINNTLKDISTNLVILQILLGISLVAMVVVLYMLFG